MAKDHRSDLVKKALTDPKFKADLLSTPGSAVEKATGVKLPAGITVKVLEDSATVVHLVLPRVVDAKPGQLSEKDLANVAGGGGFPTLRCMDDCSNYMQKCQ